jgi:beta-N-acetylhexosaminidase
MKSLIGQHVMIGLSGLSLTNEEKKFIVENNISGVTLFARNVSAEPKQIKELCAELQSLRHQMSDKAPLYIAIDMEGGRVARLKNPFTVWPPLKNLGDIDSPNMSYQFALSMGAELKCVGINLDFAPCTDVFTNPKNTVIGDRAVSTDPEMVAKHASALIRGYMKSEVIPCAKHFPGHGDTIIDSHEDLPVENADFARLESTELIPFAKSFRSKVPLLMTAHIHFPKVDDKWPVTLSEIFLKQILREKMNYRGLVITDDLDMKALSAHYDHALLPVRALHAGADILLYCNEAASPPLAMASVEKALTDGTLKKADLEQSKKRILEMKQELIPNPEPFNDDQIKNLVGHSEHLALAQAMKNKTVYQSPNT